MKQRIITGIILGVIFFVVLMLGSFAFIGLILLLALIGYKEFIAMNHFRVNSIPVWLGFLLTIMLTLPWDDRLYSDSLTPLIGVWAFLFVWLVLMVQSKNQITMDQIAMMLFGAFYIGIGFHYMIEIRMLESHGVFWVLFICVCIWTTDSVAYFVGSTWGKHKLWPEISPKKSIEGAIGGILGSIIVASMVCFFMPNYLTYTQALILGFFIAIIGQIGDLIQSALKRTKDIKDSGTIFPGHGGVLDRVDSWLMVFPIVYIFGEWFQLFTQ